jgi:phage internal scaffolding protein
MSKTKKPLLRTPYNYDPNQYSIQTGLNCPPETKAQQQFKDECDINTIVRNFGITGQIPNTAKIASYGDFSGVDDYHSALLQINASNEAFMALPASLRERFHHDPANLIKFLENDRNREEAVQLGLVDKKIDVTVLPTPGAEKTE